MLPGRSIPFDQLLVVRCHRACRRHELLVYAASVDTYKLFSSKANALVGTAVDITSAAAAVTTLARDNNDTIIAQLFRP